MEPNEDHKYIFPDDSETSREGFNIPWITLVSRWADTTTMHGIRYMAEPSKFFTRKAIWGTIFLTATGLLAYMIAGKIELLMSIPKNVNVDVSYPDEVVFPAVTICNRNRFRLSALQEHGLYDLLLNGDDLSTDTRFETYELFTGICSIPGQFDNQTHRIGNTTRSICRQLCSGTYDLDCSGFLFDRRSSSCHLSPFTGEWTADESSNSSCDVSLGVEFYRRHRQMFDADVIRTFEEDDTNELTDVLNMDEYWILTPGDANNVDNTFGTAQGHYLIMQKTKFRGGYVARLQTRYMNTTGLCAELYFVANFSSYLDISTVSILATNEDKEETLLTKNDGSEPDMWNRMFAILPTGTNQIIIEGRRSKVGLSSLAIDDFVVQQCSIFDKEISCKTNPAGNGYRGFQSQSADGSPCISWESVKNATLVASMPGKDISQMHNYCRRLASSKWSSLTCVTSPGGQIQLERPCAIPYCACRQPQTEFQCDSGMCIPESLLCDGSAHCDDASDESLRYCAEDTKVDCDFELPFVCGYGSDRLGSRLIWQRTSSDAGVGSKSLTSDCRNSTTGHYMFLNSDNGNSGDQVTLYSPYVNLANPAQLTFYYNMFLSADDDTAALTVYKLSQLNSYDQQLFHTSGDHGNFWQLATVCLPVGVYRLAFVGTIGLTYLSDLGIDDVSFTANPCSPIAISDSTASVNCSFINNLCGYTVWKSSTQYSLSYYFTEDPSVSSSSDANTVIFTGLSGKITSPNYPDVYTDWLHMTYIIVAKTISRITLLREDIEIDQEDYLELSYTTDEGDLILDKQYFGSTIPKQLTFRTTRLSLLFVSHYGYQYRGFDIRYTVTALGFFGDMLLAINLQTPSAYDQRLVISSPPFSTNGPSCLAIKYLTQATVLVYMSCLSNANTFDNPVYIYYRDRAYASPSELVQQQQFEIMAIDPNTTKCSISIAFNAQAGGSVGQIDDIKLNRGFCQPIDIAVCLCGIDYTCKFTDVSPGVAKWVSSNAVVGKNLQPVLFCQFDTTYGPGPCIVETPIKTTNIILGYICLSYDVSQNVFLNIALLFANGTAANRRLWVPWYAVGLSYTIQCINITADDVATVLRVTANSYISSPTDIKWASILKSEMKSSNLQTLSSYNVNNCGQNCQNCTTNGAGKCDVCNVGFNLNSNKTCTACIVSALSYKNYDDVKKFGYITAGNTTLWINKTGLNVAKLDVHSCSVINMTNFDLGGLSIQLSMDVSDYINGLPSSTLLIGSISGSGLDGRAQDTLRHIGIDLSDSYANEVAFVALVAHPSLTVSRSKESSDGLKITVSIPGMLAPKNVALRKRAWQSSDFTTTSMADRAVDGITDTSFPYTHTASGDNNPWWGVDLDDLYLVLGMEFTNRPNAQWRMDNLVFGLTNTAPNVTKPTLNTITVCGNGPRSAGDMIVIQCAFRSDAFRYVVVLSTQTFLSIVELEVFAIAVSDQHAIADRSPIGGQYTTGQCWESALMNDKGTPFIGGYVYSPCNGDPRTSNSLTTSTVSLSSDVMMQLTVRVQRNIAINAKINVYQLSSLGQVGRRLGAFRLLEPLLELLAADIDGPVVIQQYTSYADYIVSVCLPPGTYSVMLLVSSTDAFSNVNMQSTFRTVSGLQATDDQCTSYQHDNTTGCVSWSRLINWASDAANHYVPCRTVTCCLNYCISTKACIGVDFFVGDNLCYLQTSSGMLDVYPFTGVDAYRLSTICAFPTSTGDVYIRQDMSGSIIWSKYNSKVVVFYLKSHQPMHITVKSLLPWTQVPYVSDGLMNTVTLEESWTFSSYGTKSLMMLFSDFNVGRDMLGITYTAEVNDTTGYSMQLVNHASDTVYPFIGQWSSKEFSLVAEVLCIRLNVTAPTNYSMYIDLLVGDGSDSKNITRSTIFKSGDTNGTQLRLLAEIPIAYQPTLARAQLVLYASSQMILKDIHFENNNCPETTTLDFIEDTPICDFNDFNPCGYVDVSSQLVRWAIVSADITGHDSGNSFDIECLGTPDGKNYIGMVNRTLSGIPCQAWDSQFPHIHSFDNVNFFPDKNVTTISDIRNYCRNVNSGSYDAQPWCLTNNSAIEREFCDIPNCRAFYVKALFGQDVDIALLESPQYDITEEVCLTFRYQISNPTINLIVYASAPATPDFRIYGTLAFTNQSALGKWNKASVVFKHGLTRIQVVANKAGVTVDSQYVALDDIALVDSCMDSNQQGGGTDQSHIYTYSGERLPMSEFQQLVIDDGKQDLTTGELVNLLGQQQSSFIYSCQWGGIDCHSDVAKEITDMGQCYTINGDAAKVKMANSTGPAMGLRLLINLAQYEHVAESNEDLGIKVHLHTPDDVSLVSDLGFAVAPGVHTLVSVEYSTISSVPVSNGGSCGTQPFKFYSASETYTSAKCRMECRVQDLIDTCNCREAYMPGNTTLCTLNDFIGCVRKWEGTSSRVSCSDCINQCNVVNFVPTLSSSKLIYIDNADSDSNIVEQFNKSSEIADRTDDTEMIQTVTLLARVNVAFTQLKEHVDLYVVNRATSITTLLTQFAENVQAALLNSVSTVIPVIDQFYSVYAADVQFQTEGLVKQLQSNADRILQLQIICAKVFLSGAEFSEAELNETKLIKDDLYPLMHMKKQYYDLVWTQMSKKRGFPSNLLTSSSCKNANETILEGLQDVIDQTNRYISDPGTLYYTYSRKFKATSAELYQNMTTLSTCLLQYKQQIDSLTDWVTTTVNTLSDIADTTSIQPTAHFLDAFNQNGSRLIELNSNYLLGVATKLQLANNFSESQSVGQIVQCVDSLISDLQTSVFSKLETVITSQQDQVIKTYMSLLTQLNDLQKYMNSSDQTIETFLRNLIIWRQPALSLQKEQLFDYTLGPDETWSVWPITLGLNAFVTNTNAAPTTLSLIVKKFMQGARSYYEDAQTTIIADQQHFTVAVTKLQDYLNNFKSKVENGITSDMFARIDIYYGELKAQAIDQEVAYDIAAFFSDFGGLFGLLLGGSALSLFEIVDLIIYNAIVKLTTMTPVRTYENPSKRSPSSIHVIDGEIDDDIKSPSSSGHLSDSVV